MHNGLVEVWNLEEIPIPRCPFLLLDGAGEEREKQEPEDQGEHPRLPEKWVPHGGLQVHRVHADVGRGGRSAGQAPAPGLHGLYPSQQVRAPPAPQG